MSKNSNKNLVAKSEKIEMELHSGPIPDPYTLQKYENISPGSADRIITMAEKQQNHRMGIEKTVIESKTRDSKLGIILGFVLSLSIFFIAAFAIILDKNIVGLSLIIGDVSVLLGIFLHTKNSNRKERLENRNLNRK